MGQGKPKGASNNGLERRGEMTDLYTKPGKSRIRPAGNKSGHFREEANCSFIISMFKSDLARAASFPDISISS
jgi:hypothetical protein